MRMFSFHWYLHQLTNWATFKTLMTLHYTGWLIGIHAMAYIIIPITRWFSIISPTNLGFDRCSIGNPTNKTVATGDVPPPWCMLFCGTCCFRPFISLSLQTVGLRKSVSIWYKHQMINLLVSSSWWFLNPSSFVSLSNALWRFHPQKKEHWKGPPPTNDN